MGILNDIRDSGSGNILYYLNRHYTQLYAPSRRALNLSTLAFHDHIW